MNRARTMTERRRGVLAIWAIALAALLPVGCEGLPFGVGARTDVRPDRVHLTTDATQYASGDEVVITLSNRSGVEIGYNLCPIQFQPRVGGEWGAPIDFLRMCTEELLRLRDGGTASSVDVIPALQPGTYRILLTVRFDLEPHTVATPPFTVVEP